MDAHVESGALEHWQEKVRRLDRAMSLPPTAHDEGAANSTVAGAVEGLHSAASAGAPTDTPKAAAYATMLSVPSSK